MKAKPRARLTEAQIDEIVTAHANDETVWDKPIRVRRKQSITLPLTAELFTRAAFFARLHRETSLEQWLSRVVRERLEMEEAAFTNVKREVAARNGH